MSAHTRTQAGALHIPITPLLVNGGLAQGVEDAKFVTAVIAEQGGVRGLAGTLFVKLVADVTLPAGTLVTIGGAVHVDACQFVLVNVCVCMLT
jgi:hypothetical protein